MGDFDSVSHEVAYQNVDWSCRNLKTWPEDLVARWLPHMAKKLMLVVGRRLPPEQVIHKTSKKLQCLL